MNTIKGVKIDAFTRQYIETALWSETDNSREDGGDPIDKNYGICDCTVEMLRSMAAECADFQKAHEDLLSKAYALHYPSVKCDCGAEENDHAAGCVTERAAFYDEGDAGHDFWLTRNGHGAGFWDRGLGDVGDALTEASQARGGCNLIVIADEIHIM